MASVVMIFFFADSVMAFPGPVLVDAIPAIAAALVAAYTNSFFLLGSRASTSWLAPLVAKTMDMAGNTTLACFSFRVCFAGCAAVRHATRDVETSGGTHSLSPTGTTCPAHDVQAERHVTVHIADEEALDGVLRTQSVLDRDRVRRQRVRFAPVP